MGAIIEANEEISNRARTPSVDRNKFDPPLVTTPPMSSEQSSDWDHHSTAFDEDTKRMPNQMMTNQASLKFNNQAKHVSRPDLSSIVQVVDDESLEVEV